MPAADDDWRLINQEDYLSGRTLAWRRWCAPQPDWDHDHCEFCWAKFAAVAEDDVLTEGWTTAEDSYHWICATCFQDFRKRFGWLSEDPNDATKGSSSEIA